MQKTDKEGKKPEPVVYTERQTDRLLAAAQPMRRAALDSGGSARLPAG